jgi:hypothetical protein
MTHSDNDDKPSASKKLKQDGESEDSSSAAAAATATATTTVSYSIIHGSSNHSALDCFSFLVPTGDHADRVLAALVQSTKQHHTWTIVPDEEIDAELWQKIPACLAHPVGTLPESLPENQTEEELLDLVLTGGRGLIAKTYIVLHLSNRALEEHGTILLPILVENEQQSLQMRQAAGRLIVLYDDDWGQYSFVKAVSVWNQSEFMANIVGLGEQNVNYVVRNTVVFSDARVTRLIHMSTRQEEETENESYYEQVHDLLTELRYDEDDDV